MDSINTNGLHPRKGGHYPYQWAASHNMMTSSNGNIFRVIGLCAGNSPVTGEFFAQRPVTRSFDVFFHMCPNKRLSKQPRGWWFETPSCSLWRRCNEHEPYPSVPMGCIPENLDTRVNGLVSRKKLIRQDELEQLERLRSEDTSPPHNYPYTIESYWIPSQKKRKSTLEIQRICHNFIFLILKQTTHVTHLLKLLDKMCKYEMDPTSIVEDLERTRFCPETDGRTIVHPRSINHNDFSW